MICPLCFTQSVKVLTREDPGIGERQYGRCPRCELIFLLPAYHLSPAEEKIRYDLHQNDPDDSNYVRFLKRLTDPIGLKMKPGFCGLDFGCGPGPAVGTILGKDSVKIDHYDPHYFPQSALLDRTYDFITCSEVVEHFRKPREEFLLFNRLLKEKNGFLGIMTQLWLGTGDFSRWWYPKDPTHICFYRYETFEWIASWMGWKMEHPQENTFIFQKNDFVSE